MAKDEEKRGPGRPEKPMPAPIPASPDELARVLVPTPPRKDWRTGRRTVIALSLLVLVAGLGASQTFQAPGTIEPHWDIEEQAWKLPTGTIRSVLQRACKWSGPLKPESISFSAGVGVTVGATYNLDAVCERLGLRGADEDGSVEEVRGYFPWWESTPTTQEIQRLWMEGRIAPQYQQ